MLTEGCEIKRPGLRTTVFMAGIEAIFAKYDETRASPSPTVRRVVKTGRIFYVMAIARPAAVAMAFAQKLVEQMLVQREDHLIQLWQAAGIRTTPADATPQAPLKLCLSMSRETW